MYRIGIVVGAVAVAVSAIQLVLLVLWPSSVLGRSSVSGIAEKKNGGVNVARIEKSITVLEDGDGESRSVKVEFELKNTTGAPVEITAVHSVCACTSALVQDRSMNAGDSTTLVVAVDSRRIHGEKSISCMVETNGGIAWNCMLKALVCRRIETAYHNGVLKLYPTGENPARVKGGLAIYAHTKLNQPPPSLYSTYHGDLVMERKISLKKSHCLTDSIVRHEYSLDAEVDPRQLEKNWVGRVVVGYPADGGDDPQVDVYVSPKL